MLNYPNCGAMGGWMLIGMILRGLVVLVVIGLVVYWAMRLAMRHERSPKSQSDQDKPDPPQRVL